MGMMNITHFKPRPFPCKTAGTESRKPAFVSNFREGIGLIHELRQLAASEKLVYNGGNGLSIDKVMRHHGFNVLQAHLLLDGSLHSHQTNTILVLNKFPHRADTPVSQMVDIIDAAISHSTFPIQQIFDRSKYILLQQYRGVRCDVEAH